MTSAQAKEVEQYMLSEAALLQAREPSGFVRGLRETLNRIFLSSEGKPPAMCSILEPEEDTKIRRLTVGEIECRWIFTETSDRGRRLLYLHGGGMVSGSAETHLALASRIAQRTNMVVLLPDYRLAPEHPYPAALEDATNLTNWLTEHSPDGLETARDVFMAGDSAGGGLLLATLVNRRERLVKVPTAAATFSALCDFAATGESIDTNQASDVLLSREAIRGLGMLYGGGVELATPGISPLYGEIVNLPPLHMQASDAEVMLDDSVRFFGMHKRNGGQGELRVFPEMVHGWQGFSPYLPEAERALTEMTIFFAQYPLHANVEPGHLPGQQESKQ